MEYLGINRITLCGESPVAITSVSYCMACVYVREDYPPALASGLSPVQKQNHTMFAFARYLTLNIGLSLKGAISIY